MDNIVSPPHCISNCHFSRCQHKVQSQCVRKSWHLCTALEFVWLWLWHDFIHRTYLLRW